MSVGRSLWFGFHAFWREIFLSRERFWSELLAHTFPIHGWAFVPGAVLMKKFCLSGGGVACVLLAHAQGLEPRRALRRLVGISGRRREGAGRPLNPHPPRPFSTCAPCLFLTRSSAACGHRRGCAVCALAFLRACAASALGPGPPWAARPCLPFRSGLNPARSVHGA